MASNRATETRPEGWTKFFRNPTTGQVVIAQWPNLPLSIFLVATAVRIIFSPHAAFGTAVSIVAGVALVWWSVAEIAKGESPFRRVLGGVVLLGWLAGMVLRLR